MNIKTKFSIGDTAYIAGKHPEETRFQTGKLMCAIYKVKVRSIKIMVYGKYVDIIYNTDKFNREEKFVHASVDEMKDFLKTKDKDVIIHEEIL